jgi:polygalacturonase
MVAAVATGSSANAKVCVPESYGAHHDGATDDTLAIQKAIDACGRGDTIRLAAGVYLSGPITLTSGQTFEVAKGATLLAQTAPELYRRADGKMGALINADHAENLTLTGGGTIDGQGSAWWPAIRAAKAANAALPPRPRLIHLSKVKNLKVTQLTLQNSPSFHLVPDDADGVLIDGITIRAPADSPNTDGIDPSGHHMLMQNMTIDVGDDNVAIKSGKRDPEHPEGEASDITIRNSTFLHGHGLSIGSETNGGVSHIRADHITFEDTVTGIRIKTSRDRGGAVHDIKYSDMKMTNVGQAILITSYYPKVPDTDTAQPISATTPDIYDVTVERVTAEGSKKAGGIYGLPERPLHDIRLIDVDLRADEGLTIRNASASLKGKVEAASGPATLVGTGGKLDIEH